MKKILLALIILVQACNFVDDIGTGCWVENTNYRYTEFECIHYSESYIICSQDPHYYQYRENCINPEDIPETYSPDCVGRNYCI
jgi:hypothetical protein